MATNNPFEALVNTTADIPTSPTSGGIARCLSEEIFRFTLRENACVTKDEKALLCLTNVIVMEDANDDVISEDLLSHALFERIMLSDPKEHLLPGGADVEQELACEQRPFVYLQRAFEACRRMAQDEAHRADCERMEALILTNASTFMRQPELFQGQAVWETWKHLFAYGYENERDDESMVFEFLVETTRKMNADASSLEVLGALKAVFYPVFRDMQLQIVPHNMVTLPKQIFWLLCNLVQQKRAPELGEILIDYMTPNPNAKGADYMDTLLGQLYCLSILPKQHNAAYEFFEGNPLEIQASDPMLWNFLVAHQNSLFHITKWLLVLSPVTKLKTLQWIANCLHANVPRGHLWNNVGAIMEQPINQTASDAFMANLSAVLLRINIPLCDPQMKVLLVDPTYCAVPEQDRQAKDVNMLLAHEQTCLLSAEETELRTTIDRYGFVTEIFYLAHKAYELGNRVCIERFTKMERELQNLRNAYQDMANADFNDELAKNTLRMIKEQMQAYLCMRNVLMEPENDNYALKFFEASAIWLTEIALLSEAEYVEALSQNKFAPIIVRNRALPLEVDFVPPYLKSVPEAIVDNIVAYLSFSRHFPPGHAMPTCTQAALNALFRMIVLFMGNAKLMKNPHLRAKLAESLEILVPKTTATSNIRNTFATQIFDHHPDRLYVVRSLLNVFVSIEMTGQAVQFEQKFNYRRPMYAIMLYLWTKPEQVECFENLALEAECNMDAIEPPLFLRFINLLINDSIFLMDESLSNLQQIRELQEAQEKGEWDALPANERQQHLAALHRLGMLARFDNILGRDTINILKLLTSRIKSIFCHSSLVDRIAAMLNYLLLSLVGPQNSKFNVKDKKEFEFKPSNTVLEICHIYINLKDNEKFCLAISQDGRSYTSKLFQYTESVLVRIGGGQLIGEIKELAQRVDLLDAQYKADQELVVDAPEEYLDPIMSTLMTDPVILPSSKVTVDRKTIARHLLSDQTDPFNRAPLTMDKIIPNVALKAEIEKWVFDKRSVGGALDNNN